MEIKSAYPVVAPENSPAVYTNKIRRSYGDSEVRNKAQEVARQGWDAIEDIVDINSEDVIHIDLTDLKSSRSVRDHSGIMYSLPPHHQEIGTVIDIWA